LIFETDNQWQALGTTAGVTLNAQNMGRAGDLIEVITSNTKPLETDRGYALSQLNKTYRISGYTGLVWVRHIRYDLSGTIKPADNRKCLLNIQEGSIITEVSDTPSQLLTTSVIDSASRLKVSASTRAETQIVRGDFFVGASVRPLIPVNNDYNSVIKAPSDKYIVIEDAIIETDFTVTDSSTFGVSLTAYADISNGNDWSYTPSSPVPAGRPLNAGLINSVSSATIDLGVTTSTITGEPDYPLFFADYYLETQGNRESVSTTGSSFFDKGRQIVIAPNQEILIRTQTSGTSTGTLELKTIFFISEVGLDEAPSILGM